MEREFITVIFNNRIHILIQPSERSEEIKAANWNGTGLALCGVVAKNQTVEQWKTKFSNLYLKN